MQKSKKLLFVFLLTFSLNSQAEFISGNKLYSFMTSEKETEKGLAYGYVAGVFDVGHGVIHCAPDNVTLKQIFDMTLKFIQSNPEHRDKSADQFISAIAGTTWPCKNKSKGSTGKATPI